SLAILCLLRRDVDHARGRRAAMPVLLARWNPDDIACLDLADRLALGLEAADARDHVESLSERMRVPRGPCARLEGNAIDDDPCWRRCGDDRVLPDRARKVFGWRAARRPRSGGIDFHGCLLGFLSLLVRRMG